MFFLCHYAGVYLGELKSIPFYPTDISEPYSTEHSGRENRKRVTEVTVVT